MDYYSENLVLIGFHSCGKTLVGQLVSKQLNRQFFDMKEEIEKRNSCSLHDLTLIHGEKYISEIEKEIIDEIKLKEKLVIATTYSTVKDVINVMKLKENSLLIHLNASKYTIYRNLLLDSAYRDASELDDFYEEAMADITNQLNAMKKYYSCSDITVTVDNMTKEEIVSEIFYSYDIYKNIYNLGLKKSVL